MTEAVDAIVIGAGVVGLAIGRELARAGREVIVLEKNAAIGEETSARNSEVIHAGIYYPDSSLKARLCVSGKLALYEYCEQKHVAHKRAGKVIVAVAEALLPRLAQLARQAERNGVDDLISLDQKALAAYEPEVRGVAGLFSPSTGIIDSHGLMLALQGDLEAGGGMVALESEIESVDVESDGIRLRVRADGSESEIIARTVVNAAGLHASRVAEVCKGLPDYVVPVTRYAKGNYFVHEGSSPFKHLVYPLPVEGGLGIHATLDLSGRVRFGPDVEWTESIDYRLDAGRVTAFYEAIRSYWPGLAEGSLAPGYVGVRPKLTGPGEPAADFRIEAATRSAEATLVHLFGIESPGLTACLAIAGTVRSMVEGG